ncbi:VOC family protein [Nocardioides zeae]|uniref:VOC family protein n=1 Tax=Nocardioides imazamoxiresistens TaxID=3231893 RepID=A0ABU3PQW4_9ACTN|nr:VOC family protein [Nocardioides zeae]MDT9591620.1 VOC family protein [Nocardioides zeae]
MPTTGFYPVLMSDDVAAAAAAFYRDALGFTTTYDSDWYVSLRLDDFELAIVAHDHPTVPAAYRHLPRGVLVNLEIDDVDALHAHLVDDLGHEPVLALRDEDFGQRHFIVAAPDGVLLDVIQPIAPSAEFAEAFA